MPCNYERSCEAQKKNRRDYSRRKKLSFLENFKGKKPFQRLSQLNSTLLTTLSRYSWRPLPGSAGAPISSA